MFKTYLLLTLAFLCSIFSISAQNTYYWVGGSGDWSDVNHWATTSGGSTFHPILPTLDDSVIFDSNSFSIGGEVVTLSSESYAGYLDMSEVDESMTLDIDFSFYVGGSMILSPNVDVQSSSVIRLTGSGLDYELKTGGTYIGNVYLSNGSWHMSDPLYVGSMLFFTDSPELHTHGHLLRLNTLNYSSGSNGLLDLDDSEVEILRGDWRIAESSLRVDADSADVSISPNGSSTIFFYGGNARYRSLRVNSGSANRIQMYDFTAGYFGANRDAFLLRSIGADTLEVSKGSALKIASGQTITINDQLVADSARIESSTPGSAATIMMPAGIDNYFEYIQVQDITATGGATFTAGTGSIDLGGNTGWVFEEAQLPPVYYWVEGSGDWSDVSHWATTSGGSTFHPGPPTLEDSVIFDANSFSIAGEVVTLSSESYAGYLDMSEVDESMTLDIDFSFYVGGSMILSPNVDVQSSSVIRLTGSGLDYELKAGGTYIGNVYLSNGSWHMSDSLHVGYMLFFTDSPELHTHGHLLKLNTLNYSSGSNGLLDLDDSEVEILRGDWRIAESSLRVDADSADVSISPNGSSTIFFYGGNARYRSLRVNSGTANRIQMYDFTAGYFGANRDAFLIRSIGADTLEVSKGSALKIASGQTITINDQLVADSARIESSTPGSAATIMMPAGIDNYFEYIQVQDITATGGATFTAGTGSIDLGGNTGWIFEGAQLPPVYYWVEGSGDWSDVSHWATTSGGSTFHPGPPTLEDSVIFDANSFSIADEIVTLSSESYAGYLDMSEIDESMTLDIDFSFYVGGSIILSPNVDVQSSSVIRLTGSGLDYELKTGGTYIGNVYLSNGSWHMSDPLYVGSMLFFTDSPELHTHGHLLRLNTLNYSSGSNGLLDLDDSEVEILRGDWRIAESSLRVDADSADVSISPNGSSTIFFYGGNARYRSLRVNSGTANRIQMYDFTAGYFGANRDAFLLRSIGADTLEVSKGSALKIASGQTITINDQLVADSASIESSTPGSAATIMMPEESACFEYIQLRDIVATGLGTYTAGLGSLDLAGNSGWIFDTNNSCETPELPGHYWVGGSGDWSDVSHWATSSGGTEFHVTPPNTDDNVIFDANSFTASDQTVTLDEVALCKHLNMSAVTNNPTLVMNADLYIDGSIDLSANMSVTNQYRTVRFTSSDTGNSIQTRGVKLGDIIIIGEGEYELINSLHVEDLTLQSSPILRSNDFDIKIDGRYNGYGGTFDLGNSTVEVGVGWNNSSTTLSGSYKLILSSSFPNLPFSESAGNTYPFVKSITQQMITVSLQSGSIQRLETVSDTRFNLDATVDSLLLSPGTLCQIGANKTLTVNEYLKADSVELRSSTPTIQSNLSMPAGIDNHFRGINIRDNNAIGGATFTAGAGSIDAGNNTGWLFESGSDTSTYYWVGGSGAWSDVSHWATSSGGTTFHVTPPNTDDNVIFDANSFTAPDQTVTIDEIALCDNLNMSAVTNNPTLVMNADLYIDGSIDLSADMSVTNQYRTVRFTSSDIGNEIQTRGVKLGDIIIIGEGEYELIDSLHVEDLTLQSSPIIRSNDFDIKVDGRFNGYGGTFDLGNSTVEVGVGWDNSSTTLSGSYKLILSSSFPNLPFSESAGNTYPFVKSITQQMITVSLQSGSIQRLETVSDTRFNLDATVDSLLLSPGTLCQIGANKTLTVNEYLKADSVELRSSTPTIQSNLSMPAGIDNHFRGINIRDNNAIGGATFTAGAGSIDAGNNTGWLFESGSDTSAYYWVGGSGDWSDVSHWATSSGGTEFHASPPWTDDEVIFDENSFTTNNQNVTINDVGVCKNLNMSAVTNNPTLVMNADLYIDGSIDLSANMSVTNQYRTVRFTSSDTGNSIQTRGVKLGDIIIIGEGEYELINSLHVEDLTLQSSPILRSNDFDIKIDGRYNGYGGTFDLGNSTVEVGVGWNNSSTTLSGSYKLILSSSFPNLPFSESAGNTYPFVKSITQQMITVSLQSGSIQRLETVSDTRFNLDATVDSLLLSPGTLCQIGANRILTVNEYLKADSVELRSSTPTIQANLHFKDSTASACFEYVQIRDIVNASSASLTAGLGSLDYGNNIGWTFADQTPCNPEPCEMPFLNTLNITETTAEVSWTGNANTYDLWYRPGAGTSWTELTDVETPVLLDSLSTGTRYNVRLISQCFQDTLVATTIFTTEGPETCTTPEVEISNIQDTSVMVSWVGNASSYRLRYRPGFGSNWVTLDSVNSPVSILNLASGTSYDVRVFGFCDGITSSPGVMNFTTSGPVTCEKPDLQVTVITDSTAHLAWNETADSYTLRYRPGTGNWKSVENVSSPFTLSDLAAGTRYRVRLYGKCGEISSEQEQVIFDTSGQSECPNPVVSPSNVGETSTEISWSGLADTYTLRYRAGVGDSWNIINGAISPVILTNLASGTRYDVRVSGLCGEIGSLNGAASFTTAGPSTCEEPVMAISNVADSGADISWTGNADTYNLWYKPIRGSWVKLQNVVSPFNLTSLASGTRYNVRVYGICDGITSTPVNDSFTTTGPPACERPVVSSSNITDTAAEISWTGNADTYTLRYRAGIGDAWKSLDNVISPVSLSGLASGTRYDVRVFGNCGEISSLNGAHNFTTTGSETCEGPAITVSNVTSSDAEISWTGNSTNSLLWYRIPGNPWVRLDSATSPLVIDNLLPETNYRVRVYNICDSLTSSFDQVNFSTTAMMAQAPAGGQSQASAEPVDITSMEVYPNPSNGNFMVKVSGDAAEFSFKLVSISGRYVRIESTQLSSNKFLIRTRASEGIYFLEIVNGDNHVRNKIIIK